jgi:signal transduction histidine kinase
VVPKNANQQTQEDESEDVVQLSPTLLSPGINFVSLGVFLGAVAHELRTPVTSAQAFAQLIEMSPECTPKIKTYVKEILTACADLQKCMSPLAALLQSEEMENTESIDLNAALRDAVFAVPDTKLDLQLGEEVPPILGNPIQLRNVIQTLFRLSFAGPHRQSKTGEITIRTEAAPQDKVTLVYEDDLSPTPAQTSMLDRPKFMIEDVLAYAEFDTLILRSAMRRIRGSVALTITPEGKRRLTLIFPKFQSKG